MSKIRSTSITKQKGEDKMRIPILRPNLHEYSAVASRKIKEILDSGMVTNSSTVAALEGGIKSYLGVKEAVCMNSCTSGLMLGIQELNLRGQEVLLPSFTFCATAHAAHWNNCKIRFVDINPETFNISIESLKERITQESKAIIAVHMYGNPCDIDALKDLADDHKLKLIFDSAHAFGSKYKGKMIGGFGEFESFSCSPTKLFCTVEGGVFSTDDEGLAARMRLSRSYGSPPDYNCPIIGINARMTELNAAVGLEMLKDIERIVANRNRYAELYLKQLKGIPGLNFQKITSGGRTTHKDFSIIVDKEGFGMDRNQLGEILLKKDIHTRKYFYPPVHKMDVYAAFKDLELPHTDAVSNNVLSLPIYNVMDEDIIDFVCEQIAGAARK